MSRQICITIWTILAVLALCVFPAASAVAAGTQIRSIQGGTCDELQVVFVEDQSGSMFRTIDNVPPSDPDGLRFYGVQRAVELLSALHYQSYPDTMMRVAVVHFGDQPVLKLPWTAIVSRNGTEHKALLDNLAPALAPVSELGNTNPLAAFQVVSSLFDQAPKKSKSCILRAVIVMTDGQPWLPIEGFNWVAHLNELAQYVQEYMPSKQHDIYIIGIDKANTYWKTNKLYWDKVVGDPSHAIRAESQAHMGSLVLSTVMDLARKLGPGTWKGECIAGGEFLVSPFLQQIKLMLIKETPDLHLEIVDEAGRAVDKTRTDMRVTVEGYDSPIESITVDKPFPGRWRITTNLPLNAQDKCQVQKVSFNAVGQLTVPTDGATLTQYRRSAVEFKIVDASGTPLPDYGDPQYAPSAQVTLGDAAPVKLNPGVGYQYTGDVIPTSSGPQGVRVRAASKNPDGSEYVVFDAVFASVKVALVSFVWLNHSETSLSQYTSLPLQFAMVDESSTPIKVDIAPAITVTWGLVGAAGRTVSVAPDARGVYSATIPLDESGKHTLAYAATLTLPTQTVTLARESVTFDVLKTTRLSPKLIMPPGNRFIATDLFLRPTGLPMNIQLVSEEGRDISPGDVGAANPMNMFTVQVLNPGTGSEVLPKLGVVNTGKPGLFRVVDNKLGIGHYRVVVTPASALGREYAWAQSSWEQDVYGDPNYYTFAALAALALLFVLIIMLIIRDLRGRAHPMDGELVLSMLVPDVLNGRGVFQAERTWALPARNHVLLTMAGGLAGWLERTFGLRVARLRGMPFRRLDVSCPNETDSGASRIHVRLQPGGRLVILDQKTYPMDIGSGYYLSKQLPVPQPSNPTFDQP